MGAQRLVVIGGDAAGMSAASQARKRRTSDELQVVAFERGRATSYSACGIPYWISGAVKARDQLVSRSPEQHRRNGIDVRTRTEIVRIDLEARTVRARDLDGGEYEEPFDELVYAAGSVPIRPRSRASTRPVCTACKPSTTARPCATSWTLAGSNGW
jgi:NADPH-dependent 2,4-dienoyl-CoA reductase/sulfur reductase-like enzyme